MLDQMVWGKLLFGHFHNFKGVKTLARIFLGGKSARMKEGGAVKSYLGIFMNELAYWRHS